MEFFAPGFHPLGEYAWLLNAVPGYSREQAKNSRNQLPDQPIELDDMNMEEEPYEDDTQVFDPIDAFECCEECRRKYQAVAEDGGAEDGGGHEIPNEAGGPVLRIEGYFFLRIQAF